MRSTTRSTTSVLVSTFGGFVGLMGMEHGIGEILQGNTAPEGLMIQSWPGSDFFSTLSGEPALTILPNLLVTGILATLFSLAYLLWAVAFMERKHSSRVMALLAFLMLLTGGGIFPPILGGMLAAAAGRRPAPLTEWPAHLSPRARMFLERVWPWSFSACLLTWLGMFPGIPTLYYFYEIDNAVFIFTLLACMFGFLILTGAAGIARDFQEQAGFLSGVS